MQLHYVGERREPFRVMVGTVNIIVRPGEVLDVNDAIGERLLAQRPDLYEPVKVRKAAKVSTMEAEDGD
jgi:hypothetical protein